jgi:D-3-phosphoglycerate dehydrogenase / 2-oxoglutarate reductase
VEGAAVALPEHAAPAAAGAAEASVGAWGRGWGREAFGHLIDDRAAPRKPKLAVGARLAQSSPLPPMGNVMQGLFMDAVDDLAQVFNRMVRPDDPPVTVHERGHIDPHELPDLVAGYDFVLNDHTQMPTEAMRACTGLKHVIFLGTGARSYMHPEELAELGITVHTINGYGDTAVAEHSFALMWAAARGIAAMDRGMRAGEWVRTEGPQLTGKTVGLIGYGGIGAEMARLCHGVGMRVLAWNRTQRKAPGVTFVELDTLLAESEVVSLHLLLTDETRDFLNAERLAKLRPGVILVNTARAAVVDEAAMIAALKSGHIRHAALDVFHTEPLPPGHELTKLENVTLSAHSAFRTPEASDNLIRRALDIAKTIAAG